MDRNTATDASRSQVCCWPECVDWARDDLPLCRYHADYTKRVVTETLPRTPAHKQSGVVYYLLVGDRIKIGWTGGPLSQRLRAYPPETTVLATEPGTRADERDMHRSCRKWLVAGREWYEDCDAMRRVVAEATMRARRARQGQFPLMPNSPQRLRPMRAQVD